jgi:polar amino acid transport system ATP-binding protein
MDEGGIYEDGPPEQIFYAPQKEKTRQFIYRLSVLGIEIHSKSFDFSKAISDIEQFALRHRLYPYIRKMQMAFEELCIVYLLNQADSNADINIQFEYSKKNGTLQMLVLHNLDQIPDSEFDSNLSLTLLKHVSTKITQNTIADHEALYRNSILVEFDIGGTNEN